MTKKILVVDDESSIREALSKVLQAEDYAVVSAETGPEAVEKFGATPIDLLLLDLGLPVKDGWDTLQWLAGVNPLLPVIIITGRHAQLELAVAAGADALMEKPLNVPSLLETIRELTHEPLERRAERARQRTSGFRYSSGDSERLRELRPKQFPTPGLTPEIKCA